MKKLIIVLISLLMVSRAYAGVTWSKDWSSSNDDTYLSGGDIQVIQNDISGQAMTLTGNNAISGNNLFTGGNLFSGAMTLSGNNTLTGTDTFTTVSVSGTRHAIGTFTHDNLTTGTQSIDGIGFEPKVVLFYGVTTTASQGLVTSFSNKTTTEFVWDREQRVPGSDTWVLSAVYTMYSYPETGATDVEGILTSLDSDGFTITWQTATDIAGTMTVYYLALKK